MIPIPTSTQAHAIKGNPDETQYSTHSKRLENSWETGREEELKLKKKGGWDWGLKCENIINSLTAALWYRTSMYASELSPFLF